MLLRQALIALAATPLALAAPILDKRQGGAVRGVNLGGWLVLEPWITPGIFQAYDGSIVDEYTLAQNDPNAAGVLQSHWSSWVTQGDIQAIAGSGKGINLLRIPVGYWAFQKYGNDPYIQGAKDYLSQALDWASAAGLQVWIDLHGAPLSQNGFDNSGQRTTNPQFTSGDTNSFMAGIIGQVVDEFGSHSAVVGIELVNEPLMGSLPGGRSGVTDYYNQGSGAISGAGKAIVFSDGFADPGTWDGQLNGGILDHHDYQVFTGEDLELSYQGHVDEAYSRASGWSGAGHTVVVGEWTAAMTDCAPALNGYGIGARYDGTYSKPGESSYYIGTCDGKQFIDSWDQGLKDATRNYIQAQINAFEPKGGWIFWNFKAPYAQEWSFLDLVSQGVWP